MFLRSAIEEVEFVNAASIINGLNNMFSQSSSLRRLIMPNLTKGIVLRYHNMQAQALDDFMTGLDTAATGSETLDLRDNPGSATCDPTIGTAKGYTVLIA
jgi:hypothetical protein